MSEPRVLSEAEKDVLISKLRKALKQQDKRIKSLSAAYSCLTHLFITITHSDLYSREIGLAVRQTDLLAPVGTFPSVIQDGMTVEVAGPTVDIDSMPDSHSHVGRIGRVCGVSDAWRLADVYFTDDMDTITFFWGALRPVPPGELWEHSMVEVPAVRGLPPTTSTGTADHSTDTSSQVAGRPEPDF